MTELFKFLNSGGEEGVAWQLWGVPAPHRSQHTGDSYLISTGINSVSRDGKGGDGA